MSQQVAPFWAQCHWRRSTKKTPLDKILNIIGWPVPWLIALRGFFCCGAPENQWQAVTSGSRFAEHGIAIWGWIKTTSYQLFYGSLGSPAGTRLPEPSVLWPWLPMPPASKARYLFREMWLWTERDLALYAVVGLFLLEVYVAWTHGVWCMIAIPKHPATVAKKIMILFPVRYEPEKKARCGGLAFSTDPWVMTKRPGKAGYHDDMTGTDPTFDIPIIRFLTLVWLSEINL